jgi:DNA-binding NtrC family response regulator
LNSATHSVSGRRFSCLVLDDDIGFAGMLAQIVREEGGEAEVCHSIGAARKLASSRHFDLAVLDNGLPDGTGYDFYPTLLRHQPRIVVVMITGAPELSQAVELTRNGLFDYLTKPLGAPEFAALLNRAKLRLQQPPEPAAANSLAGSSEPIRRARTELEQAARYPDATVLLLGETGTGKDLAARFLHQLTHPRDAQPYIAVNCPNVPAEMFEAELFGSEKGAYTGADRRRTGLVEAAEGGTLFLDEVAEIPITLQPKLLRFLESREFRALGETAHRHFPGRVVAATNRDLSEEVRAGRFRQDLLYRLDVLTIQLPPLRAHIEDLEPIAQALLSNICERYQRRKPAIRPSDLQALRHHHFPGNVRELRNLLERSLLRTDPAAPELKMDLSWLHASAASAPAAFTIPAPRQLTPVELQEYQLIAKTLQEEHGGIRRAAAKLGLTHQALLRRLQKWPELRQGETAEAGPPP